ncbi:hypothetical protein [Hamadaea tsunoensis]|uniref:hypothetical protein n=1 Tax=Hamadaea tsunoensis TaxID=53368 RepID=UPI0004870A32|nr:hypothetical protein [Hamadaea tsunoensis]
MFVTLGFALLVNTPRFQLLLQRQMQPSSFTDGPLAGMINSYVLGVAFLGRDITATWLYLLIGSVFLYAVARYLRPAQRPGDHLVFFLTAWSALTAAVCLAAFVHDLSAGFILAQAPSGELYAFFAGWLPALGLTVVNMAMSSAQEHTTTPRRVPWALAATPAGVMLLAAAAWPMLPPHDPTGGPGSVGWFIVMWNPQLHVLSVVPAPGQQVDQWLFDALPWVVAGIAVTVLTRQIVQRLDAIPLMVAALVGWWMAMLTAMIIGGLRTILPPGSPSNLDHLLLHAMLDLVEALRAALIVGLLCGLAFAWAYHRHTARAEEKGNDHVR